MFEKKYYIKPDIALLAVLAALFLAGCYLGGFSDSPQSGTDNPQANQPWEERLSTPTGVMAIAQFSDISIYWNSVSSAEYYFVYRASSYSGPYRLIDNTYYNNYTDTMLSSGTYYYKVSAYSYYYGESSLSDAASATIIP